jgi:transposase
LRRARFAADLVTVRVESPPGEQLQIDFGQKRLPIAGDWVRVYLLVAVLSYSRRLFVKAFLSERQDDWREGIAMAFAHFAESRGRCSAITPARWSWAAIVRRAP